MAAWENEREAFNKIHTLLDTLEEIYEAMPNHEIAKAYYRIKVEGFRKCYNREKITKVILRQYMGAAAHRVAFWVGGILQDLHLYNIDNKAMVKKINELHTQCFCLAHSNRTYHFPFLRSPSPSISSDSEVEDEEEDDETEVTERERNQSGRLVVEFIKEESF